VYLRRTRSRISSAVGLALKGSSTFSAGATGLSAALSVIGAGAAGMAAAATGATLGLRVLVLESSPHVGGTTALSAGSVWVPNALATEADPDAAERYLAAVTGAHGRPEMRRAFLARGPEAIRHLQSAGALDLAVNFGSEDVTWFTAYDPDTDDFAAQSSLSAGLVPVAAAIADFDGDKTPDVVVANQASNDVTVKLAALGALEKPFGNGC